jgi:hypothetical protein
MIKESLKTVNFLIFLATYSRLESGGDIMGVSEKFQTLVKNLRTENHASVSERYKKITKRLNADFWKIDSETVNSRFVGSYGRGTSIKGFSDVDILMKLPYSVYERYNKYQGNGQSALLQAVKNSLAKTYPTTHLSGDGQVVVIKFSDGIKFEVVPAFINNDGSYTYPDSNDGGRWRVCNPVAEINAINEANQKYNKKVKHLVRMTKAWKRKHDVKITGMLIETLAMKFMDEWIYNDKSFLYYDWMTRDFFQYLSRQDPKQEYWIARGSKQYVWRVGSFETKAKAAFELASEACSYETDKKENSANQRWKEIFGSFFEG